MLRRQIAHGKKQTTKTSNLIDELVDQDYPIDNDNSSQLVESNKCPKCSKALRETDLGLKTMFRCSSEKCGHVFTVMNKAKD